MSIPVDLADLPEVAARQARFAYLLTVSGDTRVHAVAISPDVGTRTIVCAAGERSRANASARPDVTLVWPPATPDDFSLIVDGKASVDGDRIEIVPERAVRHRPAP